MFWTCSNLYIWGQTCHVHCSSRKKVYRIQCQSSKQMKQLPCLDLKAATFGEPSPGKTLPPDAITQASRSRTCRAGKRAQASAPEAPSFAPNSQAKSRCVIFNVFEATAIAFPEAKTQHWGHIELPFEVPKIIDEHRCMWKTLWILVLHAWRTPFKSSAIATYSFQTKPMMMEAVPDGISQHANVCWRLHCFCKMSVAGLLKRLPFWVFVPALTKQSKLLWSRVLQLIFLIGVVAKAWDAGSA